MTQEREAFEAWCKSRYLDPTPAPFGEIWGDRTFKHDFIEAMWTSWQARASLAQPASVPADVRDGINGLHNACMFRDHCRAMLAAAPAAPQPAQAQAALAKGAEEPFVTSDMLRAALDDLKANHQVVPSMHAMSSALHAALSAAPQPEAQPRWHKPAQRLVQWLHCMSYNDSYFGEPAGYLKQCVNELKHLLPPNEVPAAPSAQAEPQKPNYRAECWPESPHNKAEQKGGG